MLCREEAMKSFVYDSEKGILIWTRGPWKGKKAGTLYPNGYENVLFMNRRVAVHRIIWLMEMNEQPYEIDHIDRNRSNNRLSNLRACKAYENQRNAKAPCTNKSGAPGVLWHKRMKKWMASARIKGVINHIGYFDSFIEAVYARHEFCVANWGEFYSGMEVDVEKHKEYLKKIFCDCGQPSLEGSSYCCRECCEDHAREVWAKRNRRAA